MLDSETRTHYRKIAHKVRRMIEKDKRGALTDPKVKSWIGRRWRNLFISAAVTDPDAMRTASKDNFITSDKRPYRQRIAERFIIGANDKDWRVDMPEAQYEHLDNVTLIFVPGLLNGLLPVRAYQNTFPIVERELGVPIVRADCHPLRGCQDNVADIERLIDQGMGLTASGSVMKEPVKIRDQIILFGYSKGGPDILTYLVNHPEIKDRVRAIFNICGAHGGSYIANDMYKMINLLPTDATPDMLLDIIHKFYPVLNLPKPYNRADEMDIRGALRDLTTDAREAFNEQYNELIDSLDIPIFDITGKTFLREVPYFQMQGEVELDLYDVNNDMQLIQEQAKVHIPMETHLAMVHGHHWDVAYPTFPSLFRLGSSNLDHPFPKKALVTAIIQLAAELGLVD